MGKYIKLFNTHTEYEEVRQNLILPNVSYCVAENEVNYNPYVYDYSQDYLTFEALEDGKFQFTNAINYSIDDGTTWKSLAAKTNTPTITSGNKIMWKATLTATYGIGVFSSTGNFNVEGNPMSLLFGDKFVGKTNLSGKNYAFNELFYNCSKLISAKNLSLPAKTLAEHCYSNMFECCTSLTTAPELPATRLATTCYGGMFSGCTSLTTAPVLPATTLAIRCYGGMFYNCTSLTTAPELPVTTLATNCYQEMFRGCKNLTTAPELPATTLASNCYNSMFYGCTNLNYIKCLATDTSASNCTSYWVYGVATSGTFVKAASMSSWGSGVNAVPTGWTVEEA